MDRSDIIAAHAATPNEYVDTGSGIYYESVDFDIDDTILANDGGTGDWE